MTKITEADKMLVLQWACDHVDDRELKGEWLTDLLKIVAEHREASVTEALRAQQRQTSRGRCEVLAERVGMTVYDLNTRVVLSDDDTFRVSVGSAIETLQGDRAAIGISYEGERLWRFAHFSSDKLEMFGRLCVDYADRLREKNARVEGAPDEILTDPDNELAHKLRMIVSHATGGSCQDIDLPTNDICAEITRWSNHVYEEGKKAGRMEDQP